MGYFSPIRVLIPLNQQKGMKKLWVLGLVTLGIVACTNESSSKNTVDSLSTEIDSSFQKLGDSSRKTLKNLKRKIEDRFENQDSGEKRN